MRNCLPSQSTLGGLSLPELLRRTLVESWRDDVFGQGGRMAFYQFLAIFPALLLCLSAAAHVPHLSRHFAASLDDLVRQIFPGRVSQLFRGMLDDFTARPRIGFRLLLVCAGTVWAAHNGTWAIIYGLNRAFEAHEHRSWTRLTLTIIGLTLGLSLTGSVAVLLILCGSLLAAHLGDGLLLLRIFEWLVLSGSLLFSFTLLYRFAPDLPEHRWRQSTPGALCALMLWIVFAILARFYFSHVNDYSRSYGHINGVVMLLLWLYAANGAVLIGGEMNSEIRKAGSSLGNAP